MLRALHRGLSKRGSRTGSAETLRRRSRTALRYHLGIEVLEDRRLLTPVIWMTPAGGDWEVPGNWSTDQLPGPQDDVVINALNPGAIVTHSQNVTDTIHSLTAAAPITLSGGEIDLSGGTSTAGLLSDSSPFSLAGGTLSLASVQAGTTLTASAAGATLDRLTLGGSLSVSSTVIRVTGGLTFASGAQATVGDASHTGEIDFQGDQSIGGTGNFSFGSGGTSGEGGILKVLGNVTLGPGITVHGTNGTINIQTGSLLNEGLIDSDGGGTLTVSGSTGTSWTNAPSGTLKADGGTLTLGDAWNNAGTLAVINSRLNLGGSFSTAGLGSYTRTGGTINLTGTLNNTGATLILDAATGSWNLEDGTLEGGALATLDGNDLATGEYGGSLAGLTLGATVAGQAEPGNLLVATGGVTVTGGLTLANGTVVKIDAASFQPLISFQGDQTIGGSGQFQFAGPGGYMQIFGNLILGAGITVHGTSGTINIQTGSLLNQGTIDSDAGGTLSIEGATGTSWSNSGLITATNSTMELGGFFRTSTMGKIDGTHGFVGIAGTLTNDIPLALTDATGTIYLDGGTINGGLVTTSGSAELLVKDGGTLNAVTLDGTLDDSLFGSGLNVNITNGLTLNGSTIKLAGTNSLSFAGTQTLSGTAIVSLDSMGGNGNGLLLFGAAPPSRSPRESRSPAMVLWEATPAARSRWTAPLTPTTEAS